MRSNWTLCIVLAVTAVAFAQEPNAYQSGTILQMNSVPCHAVAGAESSNTAVTSATLCPEYVLQSERVIYHLRPRNAKHAMVVRVGERALFRIQKNRLLLRGEGEDAKEQAFVVLSIAPNTDASSADARPVRLNHLQ